MRKTAVLINKSVFGSSVSRKKRQPSFLKQPALRADVTVLPHEKRQDFLLLLLSFPQNGSSSGAWVERSATYSSWGFCLR